VSARGARDAAKAIELLEARARRTLPEPEADAYTARLRSAGGAIATEAGPGLPGAGSEWGESRGDADVDLLDLELEEGGAESRANGKASGDARPAAIRLLDAPPPAPISWPVPGLLLRDVNLIGGEAGSGKSTAILAILAAIAGGYPPFNRFPAGEPSPCLLVSEEDDRDVIVNRVEALIQGHGWDRERVLGNLHVHALDGVLLDDAGWQLHLAAEAREIRAAAIGFDPTASVMQGNAERNPEIKLVTRFCRALVQAGHAVLFGHHVTKPSEQRQQKAHRMLGGVEWFNAARMVWWCERRDTGMVLECLKASRTRRPDPLEIVRTVRTDPTNDASWLEATMMIGPENTTGKGMSDLDLAVLGVLCKAVTAPSSTDIRLLVRRQGEKGNNEEVAASVAGLMAAGLIRWERVGKAKAWSPTDEGRAAYARVRGEQRNAE
jgi:hypothetical protein